METKTREQIIKQIELYVICFFKQISENNNEKKYIFVFFRIAEKQIQFLLEGKIIDPTSEEQSETRTSCIFFRVLSIIHKLLVENKRTTKRDLFYMDVGLFQTQSTSNAAIEELASFLKVPRYSLNVFASPKGLVIGNVSFNEDGSRTTLGHSHHLINPQTTYSHFSSTASFVLIVEKDAIFQSLINERYDVTANCIIVTGKGYPDLKTLNFLHQLSCDCPDLPFYVLVDADPFGIDILLLYSYGPVVCLCYSLRIYFIIHNSKERIDREELCVPSITWIGLYPSELSHSSPIPIPKGAMLPFTTKDQSRMDALVKRAKDNKINLQWSQEIMCMNQNKIKAEIESLSAISLNFITQTYLPLKLSICCDNFILLQMVEWPEETSKRILLVVLVLLILFPFVGFFIILRKIKKAAKELENAHNQSTKDIPIPPLEKIPRTDKDKKKKAKVQKKE
ncbi:putative Meiotic recombination protein SPO11 [Monocercomonoides exilis]|uniref:putative Meiotic recombination protein SPO11 n=1 Tax=Monocercomonoides exilis TaxID=2049356 RepID=UPI0035595DBF|nr:putative Meiotic recombination protein SPO11 [Monocercomonoides exilis]|eukprot:MONOS_1248.1-p1 / transcript=MONOS_1248.1 / gene=MONOS_1248 / organism=Monocercomonoides_exilis_PA203 / gene_product=Meiotic recombination protein SPO11 / transcript_product=Meiotic recombination protein SPO11 / location=Mono_scaffold00021:108688-110389(+) / protein_length=452 / sequence_SO=supercontig / SO=protein_coding / is_pseudo=false